MSHKEQHGNKEAKKAPSKTPKEKRDAKQAKKQGDAHSILVREGVRFGAADTRRTVGKAATE